jgi:hypothetical protein
MTTMVMVAVAVAVAAAARTTKTGAMTHRKQSAKRDGQSTKRNTTIGKDDNQNTAWRSGQRQQRQ